MRKSNEKPLGKAIEEFLEVFHLKNRMNEAKIVASWEKVVGTMVANHTQGLKIRGKVLYVKVEPASLRNELFYSRTRIIHSLNRAAGAEVIDEMVLN